MGKILHLTHNDADAVGCALVVLLAHREDNVEQHFCSIGYVNDYIEENLNISETTVPESVPVYDKIIISDISINDKSYEILGKYKTFITENESIDTKDVIFEGIDHHPSNNNTPMWFEVCPAEFDERLGRGVLKSAAELLFNRYKNELRDDLPDFVFEEFKLMIESISRYDTWEWKNSDLLDLYIPDKIARNQELNIPVFEDDYYAVICKKIGAEDFYNNLKSYIVDIIQKIKENDTAIPFQYIFENNGIYMGEKIAEQKAILYAKPKFKLSANKEYVEGYLIATNGYENAVVHEFYARFPFVDIWYTLYPNECTISLRTNRDDINLSRIASRVYNGGGHKKAAGSSVDPEEFMSILKSYYMTAISLEQFFELMNSVYSDVTAETEITDNDIYSILRNYFTKE